MIAPSCARRKLYPDPEFILHLRTLTKMRKLMVILTLAISFIAVSGAAHAGGTPPECGDDCPFVR
jgi:hypothetical protein